MENELLKAYAEVDVILSNMENAYVEKIPKKMRELFKNEKLQEYAPNINPKIQLDEQNLQRKTYAILAMLNLNYWCKDENEKKELIAIYTENDKKRENGLREKYNPDDIFKNRNRVVPQEEQQYEETRMTVVQEEKWYQKIFSIIKGLFHRN